jgi:predicted transcriptional regulator
MSTITGPKVPVAADIRARRRALGITQLKLATESNVSLTHETNIEHGLVPRSGDAVSRILAALDTLESRNDNDPAGNRVEVTTSTAGRGRYEPSY